MKCLHAVAAGLLLASSGLLHAQATGPAAEVKRSYGMLKENILKSADKMPAGDYGYKPEPDIRTYARVLTHITEAQFHTCTVMNGKSFDPKSVPAENAGRDAVVAALRASFEECDRAYGALTDANVLEMLSFGQNKRTRLGAAWGNVSHDNEQYATLALYLRLKGVQPPTMEH